MQGNCVLSRTSANIDLEELITNKRENIQFLTRGPTNSVAGRQSIPKRNSGG